MRFLLVLALIACCTSVSASHRHHKPRRSPYHRRPIQILDPYADSGDSCNGQDWGTPGKFDVYVLAQSWSAEFCYDHKSYPGCQEPTSFMKTNLTMHGLWPQYNESTGGHDWPQCCTQEPLAQSTVDQYLTDLQLLWPNEQSPSGKPLDESLWSHEWSKHGTCTGLKQSDFFALALRLGRAMSTPDIITKSIGKSVKLTDLQAAYNNQAYFLCSGAFLTEVHTCFAVNQAAYRHDVHVDDREFERLFAQVDCPENVGDDSSICKADTIKISAFQ